MLVKVKGMKKEGTENEKKGWRGELRRERMKEKGGINKKKIRNEKTVKRERNEGMTRGKNDKALGPGTRVTRRHEGRGTRQQQIFHSLLCFSRQQRNTEISSSVALSQVKIHIF